eukprot:98432-Chlamydomonas_euryale.AAC.1
MTRHRMQGDAQRPRRRRRRLRHSRLTSPLPTVVGCERQAVQHPFPCAHIPPCASEACASGAKAQA